MHGQRKKEPTPIEKERLLVFNGLREELIKEGYQEKVMSVSVLKANIMVLATSVPIILVSFLLYYWIHPDIIWFSKFSFESAIFLLTFAAAIVVHELIHGFTWSLYCKKKWKSISFGMIWKYLTPYCTCGECLPFKGYFLGTLMPTLLLGFLPYAVSLVTGHHFLMLFGLCMILCGGGDLYLIWLIRKMKHALIIDHPCSVGCVAFIKDSSVHS